MTKLNENNIKYNSIFKILVNENPKYKKINDL